MRSKDEILRDLARDIAATTTPESRLHMILMITNEALIDIRDIMAQNTASEDQIREMMEEIP